MHRVKHWRVESKLLVESVPRLLYDDVVSHLYQAYPIGQADRNLLFIILVDLVKQ